MTPPTRRGEWSPLTALNELSDSLKTEAGSMKLGGIKSLPHPWGHIIVFETALLDERHPGHQDAKGQWRALLAMLALRTRYGYSMAGSPVELGAGSNEQGGRNRFPALVGRDQPQPRIDASCTWEPLHLLFAEVDTAAGSVDDSSVLIGALSPSTVVVPARDFAGDQGLRQFWAREGLRDPLAAPPKSARLSPDELKVCWLFIMRVHKTIKELSSDPNSDTATAEPLVRLLDKFADDLRAKGAEDAISEWEEKPKGDLVEQEPGKLYRAVNSVWKEKTTPDVTDLQLGTFRVDNNTLLKIVLADSRCKQTLSKDGSQISLFGSRTLDELADSTDDGVRSDVMKELREEAAAKNILLLTPEDLLADRFTILDPFTATDNLPGEWSDCLLPVKPAALLLYKNIKELANRVEKLGVKSRPRAGLQVRLTDRRGEEHEHVVRRYEEKTDAQPPKALDAHPPKALAAWPDFRFEDAVGPDRASRWKWNYLFTSTNISREPRERAVIATTGLSRELLDRDLARAYHLAGNKAEGVLARLEEWSSPAGPWPASSRAEPAGPWPASSGAEADRPDATENAAHWFEWLRMKHEHRGQNYEHNLQRSDWAFEGALFRLPTDLGYVYAGLGVLSEARKTSLQQAKAGGKAQISVDFGTSNTILYYKRGNEKFQALAFSDRLRRFNRHPDDRVVEYAAFMPSTEVEPPFATVMQIRNVNSTGEDLDGERVKTITPALWRDHAFFDPDVRHVTESLLSGKGRSKLVFDLKWGKEAEDRRSMKRYLLHIGILALAEVVGERPSEAPSSVEWSLSYPISAVDPDEYKKVLKAVVPSLATGSAAANDSDWTKVEFYTESQAVLDYFLQAQKTEPETMLVLDIGGGSTDIALAAVDGYVWQNSFRLAGDDLMTEFLLYNRTVLKTIQVTGGGRHEVFGDKTSRNQFMEGPPDDQGMAESDKNAAKAIINSPVFGTALSGERWTEVRDAEELRPLKAGAALMLGGLCVFLRTQIRALHGAKELDAARLTSIRLCFGGRGSTLFGLFQDDRSFQKIMNYLEMDLGLESPPEVTPYFSKDMKHEVAKGMLAQPRQETEDPHVRRVLGIGVTLGLDSCPEPLTFRTRCSWKT